MDEQDTSQNTRVEKVCCTKCLIVSVTSFHVYFNNQVHYKLEEKIKQAKKKIN